MIDNIIKNPIIRVAVNVPLSRLFDYLQPADQPAVPGCRVLVPFGRQKLTGVVVQVAARSEVPDAKLRHALERLDEEPILSADDLWLIRFTSDYYHHPIGEVAASALPALLRQGRQLYPRQQHLAPTANGQATNLDLLAKRAPKQAELMTLLLDGASVPFADLDEMLPGWRRSKKSLLDKGLAEVLEITDEVANFTGSSESTAGPVLNPDQAAAVRSIRDTEGFSVNLLDGVTGSGKTEVYMTLIADVLHRGQQALVLVPEIGLTPQLLARITKRLGTEPALLNSSLSDNVRLATWRAARDGSASLVLGTRSAVFVPLANAGLIIVDEEHDSSLKQQEGLRYSARDLAIARAKQLDIPVVLGSATPSLESLHRCNEGIYQHLVLPARAGNAAPPLLRLVDTSIAAPQDGLSDTVVDAIRKNLAKGGQVLVFLNRRGFAPTLICGDCGKVAECGHCDARLTVHAAEKRLMCHHCGAARSLDTECTSCGGPCRPLGHGTERLEESLKAHFPAQQIARIDSDSTRLKGTMDKALAMATSGETKILVGTQMLSKGHHFPKLTLVVVINADQGLFSTDFRGGERLAQSLVQVAGRAGRERMQGEVIIQTAFPRHPFWKELIRGGYERVSKSALIEREATAWPPYSRLALLRAAATRRVDARRFLEDARKLADGLNPGAVRILGPVSAPMERRQGRYRAQLLLQSIDRRALYELLANLRAELESGAQNRRVRWSIDVDPIELF